MELTNQSGRSCIVGLPNSAGCSTGVRHPWCLDLDQHGFAGDLYQWVCVHHNLLHVLSHSHWTATHVRHSTIYTVYPILNSVAYHHHRIHFKEIPPNAICIALSSVGSWVPATYPLGSYGTNKEVEKFNCALHQLKDRQGGVMLLESTLYVWKTVLGTKYFGSSH